MSKKIIAFSASTSSTSINAKLVHYTLSLCPEYEVAYLRLIHYEMPVYSLDREKRNGYPPEAGAFIQAIGDGDAVICSLAEHNGSFTAAFKNTLDWCSRLDKNIFQNKPMLLLSTSPGKRGGQGSMDTALSSFPRLFNANIVAHFSLPSFNHNFIDGKIIDEALATSFNAALALFKSKLDTV